MDDDYKSWDIKAEQWDKGLGELGDPNRRFNSDPHLFRMLGVVKHQIILDAGCGPGYLSRIMAKKGAEVYAVDYSPKMIEIAKKKLGDLIIQYTLDNCEELKTIKSDSMDKIVSNYVIMDLENLDKAIFNFNRVLRKDGIAVLVFSHPCFDQSLGEREGETVTYTWDRSYFEEERIVEPPWGEFTSDFIFYHRPLSVYINTFLKHNFSIEEVEEPRISIENKDNLEEKRYLNSRLRPYSIIFKLRKI